MEKICPKCGKEIPEEAAFCLFCFADLENNTEEELPQNKNAKTANCMLF